MSDGRERQTNGQRHREVEAETEGERETAHNKIKGCLTFQSSPSPSSFTRIIRKYQLKNSGRGTTAGQKGDEKTRDKSYTAKLNK